jgi:NADH:ubiquinone reductase (non-electrogenic)
MSVYASIEDIFPLIMHDLQLDMGMTKHNSFHSLGITSQVAERQGKYVAKALNKMAKTGEGHAKAHITPADPFVYRHLGSMATVGRYKALVDLRESNKSRGLSMKGFLSWIVWRSAYLTRVISWRNRFYVAVNWATTLLFGRDISRF